VGRAQRGLEQGSAAGKVVGVGSPVVGAVEGWYVPRYVIEGDAKRKLEAKAPNLKALPTWGNTPGFQGRGRTVQGPLLQLPGRLDLRAGQQRNAQELRPGNSYTNFRPGTGPALDAAVLSSYKRGEPILFYYWSPTPLMGQVDLVKLEEKPGVDKP
jgi:glycine betaine/proline transport system substrate-binding protein